MLDTVDRGISAGAICSNAHYTTTLHLWLADPKWLWGLYKFVSYDVETHKHTQRQVETDTDKKRQSETD